MTSSVSLKSPYGRRFTLRAAADYLDVSIRTLRRLIAEHRIAYHRDVRVTGRLAVAHASKGGEYFFYETELLAYIDDTRVEPIVVHAAPDAISVSDVDRAVLALMPAERAFA